MIEVRMYPAKNGDSFLITHDDGELTAILIDGGFSSTFQNSILPDLEELSKRGACLNLVVATHIDADHITGLLDFFKLNGRAERPKVIAVNDVWHNSLRSLYNESSLGTASVSGDREILREICSRGFPLPDLEEREESEISARQGSSLGSLLLSGGYRWNGGDGSTPICSGAPSPHSINSAVNITVLGPPPERLQALRQWWISELRKLGFCGRIESGELFDDAFEFMSAFPDLDLRHEQISNRVKSTSTLDEVHEPDNSLTNGSSISIILTLGKRRLLFLGDAWPVDVERALTQLKGDALPLHFDLVKLAHHGSMKSTSPSLLQLIDSPRFLISSSGARHNHPDIEVLKAVVDRPAAFQRELYFNYSTKASQQMQGYRPQSGTGFLIHESPVVINFGDTVPYAR